MTRNPFLFVRSYPRKFWFEIEIVNNLTHVYYLVVSPKKYIIFVYIYIYICLIYIRLLVTLFSVVTLQWEKLDDVYD